MRYTLLILSSLLLMSCTTTKGELSGKSFYHVYLRYTARNEFGKGGGNQQLLLSFGDNSVTLYNVREDTAATENGGHKTSRDSTKMYTAPYHISSGIVIIDSPVIPEARIEGDSLIVSGINITIDGKDLSELFNNALFKAKS